jgi:methylglutaconyl-CoA hydratase
VWLNRPEQHNALSLELGAALAHAFEALADDAAVRVVVLGGRGASFCAGADLAGMQAAAGATFEENLAEAERLARTFEAVARCPKPVVGRIHGHALGGGAGLACACDIAIAAGDARFGFAEVRLGILPALISPYVLRRLGDRHARELMLTGERFGAETAHRAGLVQHVAFPEALDEKVDERVHALLPGGPQAQARIKALLERWDESDAAAYRAALPRILAEARSSAEAREGLAAALEKRKPGWLADV